MQLLVNSVKETPRLRGRRPHELYKLNMEQEIPFNIVRFSSEDAAAPKNERNPDYFNGTGWVSSPYACSWSCWPNAEARVAQELSVPAKLHRSAHSENQSPADPALEPSHAHLFPPSHPIFICSLAYKWKNGHCQHREWT